MYQNLRVFIKINILKKLTSLQFSLCIFVGFFSHNGVHVWREQSFEEMFRVVLSWIKKTLPKPSVRGNIRSCIFLKPLPTDFIIFCIFSVMWIIYHGSRGWPFKRYSVIIITLIGRYVRPTRLRWWWTRRGGRRGGSFTRRRWWRTGGSVSFETSRRWWMRPSSRGGCQFGNVQVRVKEGVWEFVVIEVNGCVEVC